MGAPCVLASLGARDPEAQKHYRTGHAAYTRSLRSVVGIGSWSARRPWRAIVLWLAFVVAAFAFGAVVGTKSLENGAIGESARGYQIMDEHRAWPPAREYAYVHSATLTADDDAFQGAVLDAAAPMRAALGEQNVRLQRSADGHAVLVAGQVTRFVDIDRMRAAVLAAGRSHPQVTVEETGDITASDARDNAVNGDLHRAELLSVPVTLFVLLFASVRSWPRSCRCCSRSPPWPPLSACSGRPASSSRSTTASRSSSS
jgi:hypothetical protein